jgi:hypothetical protein
MLAHSQFEAIRVDHAIDRPAPTVPVASPLRRELRRTVILLAIFAILLVARFG